MATGKSRSRAGMTRLRAGRKKVAGRRKARSMRGRRRQQPETLRLRSVEPAFTVSDLERSVRFYTDVLGFIDSERWTDKDGTLRGVRLKAGLCELGLSQDDWAKGRDRQKGAGVRIWCETGQDIDALALRIRAAGHHLTEEPKDQPWGVRSLSVDDPDGFHLTIYADQR